MCFAKDWNGLRAVLPARTTEVPLPEMTSVLLLALLTAPLTTVPKALLHTQLHLLLSAAL